jgi:hypothetical protein
MPKLKNYDKQQSLNGTKGEAIWKHEEKPLEVILTAYKGDVTVTVAKLNDPVDSTDRDIIASQNFTGNGMPHSDQVQHAQSWAVEWLRSHPNGLKEDSSFTESERQHLVETIMAVRGEENQSRPASDTVSEDRMQQFRRDIEELDDEALKDSWYQWVGEWLAQRDEYYDEVDQQFKKTLRGEHDYGFV